MKNALTQQLESGLSHPLNTFELVHMALDQFVVLREGQFCHHRSFVALNTFSESVPFADLTCLSPMETGEP
jgi:hypothetical protein